MPIGVIHRSLSGFYDVYPLSSVSSDKLSHTEGTETIRAASDKPLQPGDAIDAFGVKTSEETTHPVETIVQEGRADPARTITPGRTADSNEAEHPLTEKAYMARLIRTVARGRFRKGDLVPLVGDHVEFSKLGPEDDRMGRIERILPRKNELVRPPLANLDALWIVFALTEPTLSLKVLDRMLVLAEMQHVSPVLILTKFDLLGCRPVAQLKTTPPLTVGALQAIYTSIGYPVHILSLQEKHVLSSSCGAWAAENERILAETLPSLLAGGRYVAVAGPSGVGKSTLISTLSPNFRLERGEVSKKTERGRHTTRVVSFIPVAGGWVADTPGFTSLELSGTPHVLAAAMPEFLLYAPSCRFRACLHLHEPGCAVKEALARGEIAHHRYEHYVQFAQELHEKENMRFR
ncbi:MAG: ribosome small subunit-dependent GTPase A [Candidatus Carbobacillus altaicus]|nr:ribosome small subunit-dependent GTPase A [Candidatus Carbobacillus altaicus]